MSLPQQAAQPIPRPHQRTTLAWAKNKDRIGLFHEMRLGKILTTAWWLKDKKDARRILLVAPKTVLLAWHDDLTRVNEHVCVLSGSTANKATQSELSEARWFLTTVQSLRVSGERTASGKSKAVASAICDQRWDAVVCDESTWLKNPQSQISKVCCSAFEDVQYKAILTGLPNPERSLDIFQQAKFLNGSLLGEHNYYRFREKYYVQDWTGYNWRPRTGTKEKVKAELLETCNFLSRKDAGLGNEHVRQVRTVDVPGNVRFAIRKAEKELSLDGKETNFPMVARLWVHRLCGGCWNGNETLRHTAKLMELSNLLDGELSEQQVVVWCAFTEEINTVRTWVKSKHQTECGVINGETDQEDRKQNIEDFRAGKIRVIVCQYKAAKFGINLSVAHTNIFYSLTDSQEDYFQARERIEDTGKKQTLLSIHLAVSDSLDLDIYRSLREKRIDSISFFQSVQDKMARRLGK